ncbi:hypothetical protein [Bacillus pseudomycoides]|uniref:hypothetical protein n=1 Tax=Bacillus pseudomycoides TaxID=64104 RepID=UPI000BF5EB47|nr:hypothetical protein [Bacillus pseudomycoides]PGD30526.1 hypothetical protein COM30_17820 [Bacillus pseudomycoides]PHC91989.1 hypothetical protein COF36_22435 [Bacillus pseudomycoides]PHF46123.1 hypothetical protein COF72_13140 [Bacillus pseudomycoides]
MLEKDMITLDNPKRDYFVRYAKEHKEQINANARMRRMKQKEKVEKYDRLVAALRSRGISVEELLK